MRTSVVHYNIDINYSCPFIVPNISFIFIFKDTEGGKPGSCADVSGNPNHSHK